MIHSFRDPWGFRGPGVQGSIGNRVLDILECFDAMQTRLFRDKLEELVLRYAKKGKKTRLKKL